MVCGEIAQRWALGRINLQLKGVTSGSHAIMYVHMQVIPVGFSLFSMSAS